MDILLIMCIGILIGNRFFPQKWKSLNEKLEIADPRSVKGNSSYYLLKKSPSVTVIAECGFLTNPSEVEKLEDEAYQYKVAEALTGGIEAYLARGE